MKDVPYSVLKENPRAYQVLLLHDQQGKAFADIAKESALSVAQVRQIYSKIKIQQIRLYILHLSAVLGQEHNAQIRAVFEQAWKCYGDFTYACAYLEIKYSDLLTPYRAGEPGMPEAFIKAMPPFKCRLQKKTVARIVALHEKERLSFAEIGKRFKITPERARDVYDTYYHEKVLAAVEALQQKAGSREEQKRIWQYYFDNEFSPKRRYGMLPKE